MMTFYERNMLNPKKIMKVSIAIFISLWLGVISVYCRTIPCEPKMVCHKAVVIMDDSCYQAPIHCHVKTCQLKDHSQVILPSQKNPSESLKDRVQSDSVNLIYAVNLKECHQCGIPDDVSGVHHTLSTPLFLLNLTLII